MSPITTAVFPVAGLGTRFLPVTKSIPKELIPIGTRPLIEYAVEEAIEAGIQRFIFVNARSKSALEAHFRAAPELEQTLALRNKSEALARVRAPILGAALNVVYQDVPLGLGHAVLCAKPLLGNAPFAVLLPDDFLRCQTPCLKQMIDAWQAAHGNMVATLDVGRKAIKDYGCLDVTTQNGALLNARAVIEKPEPLRAPSTYAIIGRYILMPSVLNHLTQMRPGAGGEIQLTDAIADDLPTTPLTG